MKRNPREKTEHFQARKERAFLKLIGQEQAIQYATPIATK